MRSLGTVLMLYFSFRGDMGDDRAEPDHQRQGQGSTLAAARPLDAARRVPPGGPGPEVPPEPGGRPSPAEGEAENRAQQPGRRCQLRVGRRLCRASIAPTGLGLSTPDFGTGPLGAKSVGAAFVGEQKAFPPPWILSPTDDISQGSRRHQDELGQPPTEADLDAGRCYHVKEFDGEWLLRR